MLNGLIVWDFQFLLADRAMKKNVCTYISILNCLCIFTSSCYSFVSGATLQSSFQPPLSAQLISLLHQWLPLSSVLFIFLLSPLVSNQGLSKAASQLDIGSAGPKHTGSSQPTPPLTHSRRQPGPVICPSAHRQVSPSSRLAVALRTRHRATQDPPPPAPLWRHFSVASVPPALAALVAWNSNFYFPRSMGLQKYLSWSFCSVSRPCTVYKWAESLIRNSRECQDHLRILPFSPVSSPRKF